MADLWQSPADRGQMGEARSRVPGRRAASTALVLVLRFLRLGRRPSTSDAARLVEAVISGYDKFRPLAMAERALLPMVFDLVNLVEAAGFLGHQPDVPWVAHVDECHSWLAYRLNAGRDW